MNMHNSVSGLQVKYDEAENKRATTENAYNRIRATAASETLVLGNIKLAVSNLYQVICIHRHYESELNEDGQPKSQAEKLLDVGYFMQDLEQIIHEIESSSAFFRYRYTPSARKTSSAGSSIY